MRTIHRSIPLETIQLEMGNFVSARTGTYSEIGRRRTQLVTKTASIRFLLEIILAIVMVEKMGWSKESKMDSDGSSYGLFPVGY